MTSPDGARPKQSYPIDKIYTFRNMDRETLARLANEDMHTELEGVRGNLFTKLFSGFLNIGKVIGGIADAVTGIFSGGGFLDDIFGWGREKEVEILDLQDRTQILEGITGYASFVMPVNRWLGIDANDPGKRVLPFTQQVGPWVGVDTGGGAGNGKVRLLSKGLWRVDAQTRARATTYTGGHKNYIQIIVLAPNGSIWSLKESETDTNENGYGTLKVDHTFVVPAAGYFVTTNVYSDRWRWFLGGTKYSSFSLVKHSSEAVNLGGVDPGDPGNGAP